MRRVWVGAGGTSAPAFLVSPRLAIALHEPGTCALALLTTGAGDTLPGVSVIAAIDGAVVDARLGTRVAALGADVTTGVVGGAHDTNAPNIRTRINVHLIFSDFMFASH